MAYISGLRDMTSYVRGLNSGGIDDNSKNLNNTEHCPSILQNITSKGKSNQNLNKTMKLNSLNPIQRTNINSILNQKNLSQFVIGELEEDLLQTHILSYKVKGGDSSIKKLEKGLKPREIQEEKDGFESPLKPNSFVSQKPRSKIIKGGQGMNVPSQKNKIIMNKNLEKWTNNASKGKMCEIRNGSHTLTSNQILENLSKVKHSLPFSTRQKATTLSPISYRNERNERNRNNIDAPFPVSQTTIQPSNFNTNSNPTSVNNSSYPKRKLSKNNQKKTEMAKMARISDLSTKLNQITKNQHITLNSNPQIDELDKLRAKLGMPLEKTDKLEIFDEKIGRIVKFDKYEKYDKKKTPEKKVSNNLNNQIPISQLGKGPNRTHAYSNGTQINNRAEVISYYPGKNRTKFQKQCAINTYKNKIIRECYAKHANPMNVTSNSTAFNLLNTYANIYNSSEKRDPPQKNTLPNVTNNMTYANSNISILNYKNMLHMKQKSTLHKQNKSKGT
jgi:hypothetical protein